MFPLIFFLAHNSLLHPSIKDLWKGCVLLKIVQVLESWSFLDELRVEEDDIRTVNNIADYDVNLSKLSFVVVERIIFEFSCFEKVIEISCTSRIIFSLNNPESPSLEHLGIVCYLLLGQDIALVNEENYQYYQKRKNPLGHVNIILGKINILIIVQSSVSFSQEQHLYSWLQL